jgi:hypothetical protein
VSGTGVGRVRARGAIFFLVLFSIIEFGRYVYTVQILNEAAARARYAIVHGSESLRPSGPCR